MTQEQYERAESVRYEIKRLKIVLEGVESDNGRVFVSYYGDGATIPTKEALYDSGLNAVMKNYLTRRITELEKEFEGL